LKENFDVISQEWMILCPEDIIIVSTYFKASKRLFGKKVFPSKIRSVELRSIVPPKLLSDAILQLPGGGFEISYKRLLSDAELYLMNVDYEIEDPRFIENLVRSEVSREAPKEHIREYWMSAQLKTLKPLEKMKVHGIELRDLDFTVNVATYQDVKTSIPGVFQREVEIAVEWMRSRNREEKGRLDRKHLQIKRAKPSQEDILIVLRDLQRLFSQRKFKKFLDIKRDFYYHGCVQGKDFYDMAPFPTWPKYMEVISRTNLSLEEPASEGVLVYDQGSFKKEVGKLFSKQK